MRQPPFSMVMELCCHVLWDLEGPRSVAELCLTPWRLWVQRSAEGASKFSFPVLMVLHCSSRRIYLEWFPILSYLLPPSGSQLNPFWLKLLRTLCPLSSCLLGASLAPFQEKDGSASAVWNRAPAWQRILVKFLPKDLLPSSRGGGRGKDKGVKSTNTFILLHVFF